MPSANGSQIIALKVNAKCTFSAAVMLFLYIVQKTAGTKDV